MKCANCQMLNNIPETPCSHCGRMMPALKPVFISKDPDDGETSETSEESGEVSEKGAEAGEAQGGSEAGIVDGAAASLNTPGPDPADEGNESGAAEGGAVGEVETEHGHVDNVGDPAEKETIT